LQVINLRQEEATLARIKDAMTNRDVRTLACSMLQYDRLFSQWRTRHLAMTRRMIGWRPGTGHKTLENLIRAGYEKMGSAGLEYLKTTLKKKFYPLLWKLKKILKKPT
jgi:tryptophan 2,3-dioxygenase